MRIRARLSNAPIENGKQEEAPKKDHRLFNLQKLARSVVTPSSFIIIHHSSSSLSSLSSLSSSFRPPSSHHLLFLPPPFPFFLFLLLFSLFLSFSFPSLSSSLLFLPLFLPSHPPSPLIALDLRLSKRNRGVGVAQSQVSADRASEAFRSSGKKGALLFTSNVSARGVDFATWGTILGQAARFWLGCVSCWGVVVCILKK